MYLAVVMDRSWNREVIGWSIIANHIRAQIVCDAFEMAKPWQFVGPDPSRDWSTTGASFTAPNMTCWASREGSCAKQGSSNQWEASATPIHNATRLMSFFATLQTELLELSNDGKPARSWPKQSSNTSKAGYRCGPISETLPQQPAKLPVNYRHQQQLVA